jgi:PmbA protein
MSLQEICEITLREARQLGAEDAIILASGGTEQMVRFSHNSITTTNSLRDTNVTVSLGSKKRQAIGSTSNPSPSGLKRFLTQLYASIKYVPESPDYPELPKGPMSYTSVPYDAKIGDSPDNVTEYAKMAVDSALEGGADRVAGVVKLQSGAIHLLTSSGLEGENYSAKALLNVRAFKGEASGHGVACEGKLSEFKPDEAGQLAGDYAKRAEKPGSWSEGDYDIIFNETVTAHLFEYITSSASAFQIDSGLSFLAGELGKEVGVPSVTVWDTASSSGAPNQRSFDDEGTPVTEKPIIEKGVLKTYLHNLSTAKRYKSHSTGNAGIVDPEPWNIILEPGSSSMESMVRDVKKGVMVTNTWYTRFQNHQKGDFSTMPRDAAFLIENGEIKHPITGFRLEDSFPRLLKHIDAFAKTRKWVEWWEVNTPTLAPAMLVRGSKITKAET